MKVTRWVDDVEFESLLRGEKKYNSTFRATHKIEISVNEEDLDELMEGENE